MRFIYGVIGALIGVAIGILFASNPLADLVTSNQNLQSPDDAAASHGLAWLISVWGLLIVGWFAGWLLAKKRDPKI